MNKKILRELLEETEQKINILNIKYVGTDLISDLDYDETIRNLRKVKNYILDILVNS